MSESGNQSETDSFSDDVLADDAEIRTTVFEAVIVLLAFSLDIIGFECCRCDARVDRGFQCG